MKIEKRGSYIYIIIGKHCLDAIDCSHAKKCNHKESSIWHNINAWIINKLHIRLPIIFYKEPEYLSGTKKCKFRMPERPSCYKCKHDGIFTKCDSINTNTIDNPYWGKVCDKYEHYE